MEVMFMIQFHFYQSFDNLANHFDITQINYFVGDAAYITGHICKTIIDLEMIPAMPYTRKGYKKDYFKNMNISMMNIMIFIYAQMKKI